MKMGGLPFLARGDEWPYCGHCSTPLTFVAQLLFNRQLVRLLRGDLVVVFYCFCCNPRDDHPWDSKAWLARVYRSKSMGRCERRKVPEGAKRLNPCSLTKRNARSLPSWQLISDVSGSDSISNRSVAANPDVPWEAYDLAVKELVGEQSVSTHIGGYPHGPQGGQLPRGTEFLAQLDSMSPAFKDTHLGWGDCGVMCLYVSKRPPHRIRLRIESC